MFSNYNNQVYKTNESFIGMDDCTKKGYKSCFTGANIFGLGRLGSPVLKFSARKMVSPSQNGYCEVGSRQSPGQSKGPGLGVLTLKSVRVRACRQTTQHITTGLSPVVTVVPDLRRKILCPHLCLQLKGLVKQQMLGAPRATGIVASFLACCIDELVGHNNEDGQRLCGVDKSVAVHHAVILRLAIFVPVAGIA